MTPTVCQGRCFYCTQREDILKTWKNNPDVTAGYQKVFDVLNLAKAEKLISPDAFWMIASGEITVHPYRKEILNLVRGEAVMFFTNAFIFDKDIARELHDNPRASINLSIDSGTAETWRKVKGVDNFNHVLENLKNYSAVAHHPEQITLKYIVLPGINDSEEDFQSVTNIKKFLHISNFNVSRDNRIFVKLSGTGGVIADKVFDPKLIESAARLSAIHMKKIGSVSFSNFTPEEERQILILAKEILKYM